MKQYLLLLLLATTAASAAQAQSTAATTATKGPGRLTGRVVDAATGKPVEFATVALLPATGPAPLLGGTADAEGKFELRDLPTGAFRLQISFVGYAARLEPVTIGTAAQDLGTLPLTASAQNLAGVTVTGERPVIETKPDRLVYNADQDASNAGGTAADVLRKTPMVNLDGEGNVQLRGTSNVRILLNNKPSALLSGNLADALKQIPADQIKAIEVVTAPSARYDGEGSGGVINIVLKKNNLEGVNGSLGASTGNRNQSLNGSLNAKKGKVGLNTKLSAFHNVYPFKSTNSRTDFLDPATTGQLLEQTTSRNIGNGGYGQVELTYDPSALHSFTLSGNGNLYDSRSPRELFNRYQVIPYQVQSPLDTLYSRDINNTGQSRNYDLNAGYTRTFGEAHPGREWVVLAQHTNSRREQSYRLDQFPTATIGEGFGGIPGSQPEPGPQPGNHSPDRLYPAFQGEKNKLEVGAKRIGRQVRSDYNLDTLLVAVQPDFARSARRSNRFDYRQNVLAGYGTYGFALGKKNTFSLGARLEHTAIEGEFQNEAGRFSSTYLNVLPSLNAIHARSRKRARRWA